MLMMGGCNFFNIAGPQIETRTEYIYVDRCGKPLQDQPHISGR